MGFKSSDLFPSQVTANTPPSKTVQVKIFQLTRSDTTATVKAVLPGDASVIDFLITGPGANPGGAATIRIGNTPTATEYVNNTSAGGTGGAVRASGTYNTANLPNLENAPVAGDISLYAGYAETGTPSTVGGPWTVYAYFVR